MTPVQSFSQMIALKLVRENAHVQWQRNVPRSLWTPQMRGGWLAYILYNSLENYPRKWHRWEEPRDWEFTEFPVVLQRRCKELKVELQPVTVNDDVYFYSCGSPDYYMTYDFGINQFNPQWGYGPDVTFYIDNILLTGGGDPA